ncbi:MAG TPA: M23 family metallopeptidase [Myxococcales bacterium]|nr:M23 family metallopeptidase [Myxococcales bacterium]HIK86574.1 M23 family metallopeptidase [Myxococcales bacterium]
MRFEPFSREGLRSLMDKLMPTEVPKADGSKVARSGVAWVLAVIGLVLGFGIGSQMGTAESADPLMPHSIPVDDVASLPALPAVMAADKDAAADVRHLHIDNQQRAFAPVITVADSPPGQVLAKYASVSIDSLPIHHSTSETTTHESFTLVTRGEIGLGESLGSSLRRQGISPGTVHLIATEMRKVFDFRRSRPGDQYRLGQDSDGRVLDFRYSQGPEESFYLAWEGTRYTVRKETAELQPQIAKIAGVIDSSFYGAVLSLGEQSALASEFARILAWDIDFSRNVHQGDEFQILYERLYRRNDDGDEVYVRPGRVLAGRYDGRVGEHTVVYFEDERGIGAYFRPDGSSVERAFLAAPLEFSRISSRFTRARAHPILNVTRPHLGIDYAAPRGTPVWAVADGVVEYRARAGASGNLIRIRHAGGYTSHYAHLSKFAAKLSVGDRVEQKQLIGYVGSTGLSTGPHVCFRVKKDGNYVDPMRIASPAGAPVDVKKFVVFQNIRDQLLADLGPGPLNRADEAL